MGRKIPGQKHKGVKDPEKQKRARLDKIKNKINSPPDNVDDQPIPKSLQRIIELKKLAKNQPAFKKKSKKPKSKLISLESSKEFKPHPKSRPEKAVPVFKQLPNENRGQFMHRVTRETHNFLKETEFEKKYRVQVKRSPQTGEILGIEKPPKDEIDELFKHKNIRKKNKKKEGENVKLTKLEKKKQKSLLKKQKEDERKMDDGLQVREKIQFGEIAHQPPEFTVKPKKAPKGNEKPGKKGLLLQKLFEAKKSINKSGKRKDLPLAERTKLEQQQSEAIAAYRLIKSQKSAAK